MMKSSMLTIVVLSALAWAQGQSPMITGFSAEGLAKEQALEKNYDQWLDAKNIDLYIREMSARPHHVGSPGNKLVANYIFDKFKSWGFDTRIETFYVLFPTPKLRILEMTEPTAFKAGLMEKPLAQDATSGQTAEQLPPYNCWSPDGDVTGELVFVNYGLPEDYEWLERLGIDVRGKIVIAKYGRSWRGIKPKVAQEHGALGCIIYSDPKEDGYFQGDVYPNGAFKNEYGVQRGSVMDMSIYPGDPLTPGIGATKDAKRLDRKDAVNLLKIPVLPISYHDAAPLLQSLGGPVAPADWRGALPFTYHIGPGKTRVHLKLEFNWDMQPIQDIVATIPGREFPDEWVIRGNHHDAWVNGANDPISGQAALLEEARAIGELVKTGWKPRRSLVYCAWDAEEPALIGSTEWVETHIRELQQKAVVYINSDDNGRGFLSVQGSHALEPFVNEVARDVPDPETKISILERLRSQEIMASGANLNLKKELLQKQTISIGAMGSGSDYSPFIHHAGVPSINLAFGGEDAGGEYHSIYDSYDDYRRFKDPNFEYGVLLAKTAGRMTLRMAEAGQLPFDYRSLYQTIQGYVSELSGMSDHMRMADSLDNQVIREKRDVYAADPTLHILPGSAKQQVPYLNFSRLQNAMIELRKSTGRLSDSLQKAKLTVERQEEINRELYRAEQKLLSADGLPRRSWYKHSIYAPGLYTGYGVKTLPGIREAIEQRNWKEAQEQIDLAATLIEALGAWLEAIAQTAK
jgi:N-acetylated-alpha-linked acidic dipeptidase